MQDERSTAVRACSKQRSAFWDNYKGILIILVVFGHFIYNCATQITNSVANDVLTFIYLFHMPAFAFCSGFLSKSETACGKKSLVKLGLCYLLVNTLFMLYYYFVKGAEIQLLSPYASAWYILSLITWRLVAPRIAGHKWLLPVAFAAALLVGFWNEFSYTLSLGRTVAFYPFFLWGYLLDGSGLQERLRKRKLWLTVLCYGVAAVGAAGLFLLVRRRSIPLSVLLMEPYTSGRMMFYRVFFLVAASAAVIALLLTVPDKRLPLLTKIGKNSLLIYLVHRFITFGFNLLFPTESYSGIHLIYAAVATAVVVLIFGADWLNRGFHKLLDSLSSAITQGQKTGRRAVAVIMALALLVAAVPLARKTVNRLTAADTTPKDPAAVTADAIKLAFVGDLILLKDQVESAYDAQTGEYVFDEMFTYAAPYLADADLAIGVFEGPTAGEEAGYTTSDFYDRIRLFNNFPDSFAQSVKAAGIDLVTLANNHLLDMGQEGALRTLDVLDRVGLEHTGAYRSQEEKDTLLCLEVDGVRIAVLSYCLDNNQVTNQQIYDEMPYITSFLPNETDPFFEPVMEEIREDFREARESADVILVLPHMGTQFSHTTDEIQQYWNQVFADLGADIILGDHAHAVQPIEQLDGTLIVNCPGNYANSYIHYNGDATAIVEIYIDRTTKKTVASAVIPMYTQELRPGFFRAIPTYEIFTKNELYEQLPNRDRERAGEVQELVTKVMVGRTLTTDLIQPRYYYIDGQYCPMRQSMIEDIREYENTRLYQLLEASDKVVFLGDSITHGYYSSGHGWYEPLMSCFPGKEAVKIAKSSYTTSMLLENYGEQIRSSGGDLYIIAIGTNDVRYWGDPACAMSPEEYVADMDALIRAARESNPDASFVLLSPWMTLDNDRTSELPHAEKLEKIALYSEALEAYALEQGHCYLNPNSLLLEFFEEHQRFQYTYDGIHPNSTQGIDLYSWAVLECGK